MAKYTSQYTGQQIDNAIGTARGMATSRGLLKSDGSGTVTAAVAGTDYQGSIVSTVLQNGTVLFLSASGAASLTMQFPVYEGATE